MTFQAKLMKLNMHSELKKGFLDSSRQRMSQVIVKMMPHPPSLKQLVLGSKQLPWEMLISLQNSPRLETRNQRTHQNDIGHDAYSESVEFLGVIDKYR